MSGTTTGSGHGSGGPTGARAYSPAAAPLVLPEPPADLCPALRALSLAAFRLEGRLRDAVPNKSVGLDGRRLVLRLVERLAAQARAEVDVVLASARRIAGSVK